jgi:adenylate kinase
MLAKTIDGMKDVKGIIYDGFPRTVRQAEELKLMLNERGMDISTVIELDVDEDELVNRLLERGKVQGRADDNPETIRHRLDVYQYQTKPVSDYYAKEGKLHLVKGVGSVEDIFNNIKEELCQIS